ncbi:uncharacterized protein Tco025E_03876 [Trypanosoma conorhini]|uniref:Uncharacterized protein n=1 Tax=Trypanosoma conorhini TaxID=83891 RepID=A0A422PRB3_9TRYP|nr:uncharacterized protein Tco025E_03876 [Trypanosoma conorhini]RNF20047.1 hypothetical protein Tco025E_03876 [Trypanosoma conorhini]
MAIWMMMMCRTCYFAPAVGNRLHRLAFLGSTQVAKRSHTTSKQQSDGHADVSVTAPPASPLSSAPLDADAAAPPPPEDPTRDTSAPLQQGERATDVEPLRWVQNASGDPLTEPIVDDKGQFIVSRVQWPTGEIAYTTPPPPDGKLSPRFGYNVVQVKKSVSWWKHYQKYPRFSIAHVNIHVLFLLGAAWLLAFLSEEYRRTMEEMRTPGAMVGEQRGRGSVNRQTQKVAFTPSEMSELVGRAQNNWLDARAEANYIGSKEYSMKKIPRPKEFSMEDFRKR